jgi:hypothetical protein
VMVSRVLPGLFGDEHAAGRAPRDLRASPCGDRRSPATHRRSTLSTPRSR